MNAYLTTNVMRILVITKSAWDDQLASGNTLSNLLGGWNDASFFCLYSRDAAPNNRVCKEYYSVSPISILKNLFQPWKIGRRFSISYGDEFRQSLSREKKWIEKAKKQYKLIFKFICDLAYATNLWKNKTFKNFIYECNPDIVFCFGQADPFTYRAVKYAKWKTKARIISYYVDDLYQRNANQLSFIKKSENRRLVTIANMSDKCYAISELMCLEYRILYDKPFELLHKGCEVFCSRKSVNSPIRFIYAGNLYYNRDKVLSALASVIKNINIGSLKARLDIYSGTHVSNDVLRKLNIEGTSSLHDARPYEEIKQLMRESDIVLHVESFDELQMEQVRLSFSTKITDCMQSGSMVMAIGPDSIASIEYLTKVPGCVVVNNIDDLDAIIHSLIMSNSTILNNALMTNDYARDNIELCHIRERLKEEFEQMLG